MTTDVIVEDILDLGTHSPYNMNRDFLCSIFKMFGWKLEHAEPGNYDDSRDGYLVFEKDNTYIRIDLQDDSYSGGYFDGYTYVKPKMKTIKVYE